MRQRADGASSANGKYRRARLFVLTLDYSSERSAYRQTPVFRLHEKGVKRHQLPVHHNAEEYVDAHLETTGIVDDKKGPLFGAVGRNRQLTRNKCTAPTSCAWFTGELRRYASTCTPALTFPRHWDHRVSRKRRHVEKARQIAAHESPRTTKLYDRTSDELTLDEIQRIVI